MILRLYDEVLLKIQITIDISVYYQTKHIVFWIKNRKNVYFFAAYPKSIRSFGFTIIAKSWRFSKPVFDSCGFLFAGLSFLALYFFPSNT